MRSQAKQVLFAFGLGILFLLSAVLGLGQVNTALLPVPKIQFLSSTGTPLSGGKVCTYSSGTSTPLATYTDSTGTVANANPIVLDSGGFANIWLSSSAYKIVLRTAGTDGTCSTGTIQWTVDGVSILNQTLVDTVYLRVDAANTTSTGTSAFKFGNLNNVMFANSFAGANAGAKIAAAITALPVTGGTVDARGLEGAQTISANLTLGSATKPVTLLLGAATYTLTTATIILQDGSAIIGMGGMSRDAGKGTTIQRTAGTTTMISATGIEGTHVRGFLLRGLFLNGGDTAGHGIVLDYVDTFKIEDVQLQDGGASNALRLLNEVWDYSVVNSSFNDWGDATNYTVDMVGLDATRQITDGHWYGVQLGEVGDSANGNPVLRANGFVAQHRFVDVKFHHTGGTMTHLVDWSGYRSDFIGCSFQADTASSSGGMVRIKGPDNRIIGGGFNDVTNGDAIHFSSSGGGIVAGATFRGTGAPSPGSAVVAEATSTGGIAVSGNEIINLTKGYDFSTGTGTRAIGPSTFTGVTTPLDASGVGATWVDYHAGKMTATFGGANLPTARSAATLNPVLRLGGNVATNSVGYQGLYLFPLFSAGGTLNELLGMGSGWLAGIGSQFGTEIEHPFVWGYNADTTTRLFSIYAKQQGTPLGSGDEKVYFTTGGDAVIRRLKATQGTALGAGDFALSAGWGDTPAASISAVVGTDQATTFTVSAGTANFSANPTVTLTFKDLTWTSNPICVANRGNATAPTTGFATTTTTATTMVLTFQGTPGAGTYLFNVICMGR